MAEVSYEVALTIAPDRVREFDQWLEGHIGEMLTLPGFRAAHLSKPKPLRDGRFRRIVRYRVTSREALERYFAEHAERMRADGRERFGERLQARRQVYPSAQTAGVSPCLNCAHPEPGRYCPACGQEQKSYHIAFSRLILDYLGDAFMFDSRLFQSLASLFFKPGRLTRENLDGRRARYIPALRLYLFSALVFFTLSTLVLDWQTANSEQGFDRGIATIEAEIAADREMNAWERLVAEAGIKAMERPDQFMQDWLKNISLSMLVFLPLYALFLKLLYFRLGYFYLEHLIFALHVHALLFCVFTITILYSQYIAPFVPAVINGILAISMEVYAVFYALPALKQVYKQGWPVTVGKFLLLGLLYVPSVLFGVIAVMFASLFFF